MEVENECCDDESSKKLSILVVDVDTNCLLFTSDLLKKEKYKVVTAKNASDALNILRASGNSFDFVITEVHMPEMNGFQLQEQINKEFGISVVFMSYDKSESTINKGIESGGAFFILKPISQDDIRDLWQYAIMQRKKKKNKGKQVVESSSSINEESNKKNKSKRNEQDEIQVFTPSKKSKLIWTEYLHNKFLDAITKLGLKRAVPRKILDVMNIPELTRANVASHLQKYRAYLMKVTTGTKINSSNISFNNTNQSATSNVINPISTQLLNDAATSAQQRSTLEDMNFATAHDTNFLSVQKDKMFAGILSRHNMMNNIIPTSNSSVFNNQLNIQSATMDNNTIEEGTNLSYIDGSNQYQQPYFPWIDDTLIEQENHIGVTTEERSFQFGNSLLNSEVEQENYFGITIEENSFQFDNALLISEVEQENYFGITTEENSFQFDNALQNSEVEQENYAGVTTEERSFQLDNALQNAEVEQENYAGATTEERSFQLDNALQNAEVEEEIYGGITTAERSFQFHNTLLNLELDEQENYGGITAEERSFQIHNAQLNSNEQKDYQGITAEEGPFHPHI